MRIEISVAVDSVADPYETGVQSRAHAEAVFTGIDRQAVGDPTVGCSSRGLLEQALLNAGHGQWKKPESPPPLTGEVPYTLSPRPGDSLSLPVAEDPRFAYPASLETCAWDSLDQPYLQGQGEVAYAVTAQGIPDTATLTIRTLHGVDTGTFQRAARRLVAHCRFHPRPLASGESTGLVRQRLFFGASEVLAGSYKFPGDVFISHGSPVDSLSQLEEATVILCPRFGPGLPPGRVELQFVVGVDGKPEPSTMQAVNATSPALASVAPGLVMACRFRPARWKGRPVRSAIILPMRVGP